LTVIAEDTGYPTAAVSAALDQPEVDVLLKADAEGATGPTSPVADINTATTTASHRRRATGEITRLSDRRPVSM
jgi:hypothetical protein